MHSTKRALFFFEGGEGGVAPSLFNIKGLYPISWLSQKSKTNENIPASDPLLQFTEEKEVRRERTERGMKGGNEGGGHLNTGLNTAVKKKGDRRKEVNERRVDLTGRLFLGPE